MRMSRERIFHLADMIVKELGEEAGLRTFREIVKMNGLSVRKGGPFADRRTRQALGLAVDRDAIENLNEVQLIVEVVLEPEDDRPRGLRQRGVPRRELLPHLVEIRPVLAREPAGARLAEPGLVEPGGHGPVVEGVPPRQDRAADRRHVRGGDGADDRGHGYFPFPASIALNASFVIPVCWAPMSCTPSPKMPKNFVLQALQELMGKGYVKRKAREKAAGYWILK